MYKILGLSRIQFMRFLKLWWQLKHASGTTAGPITKGTYSLGIGATNRYTCTGLADL